MRLEAPLFPGFLLLLLALAGDSALAGNTQPKYGPKAAPLLSDHQYFRRAEAADFWRLMPFYVPQANAYSCSIASLAMVFNAAMKGNNEAVRNLTQDDLLNSVRGIPLRALVSKEGLRGRHGLTLDELKTAAEQTARRLGTRTHVTTRSFQNPSLEEFRDILRRNENCAADFLLAHFIQDDLTGAGGGPYAHISPIGAYDPASRRVLILDVDREWYSPYWVSDEDLLRAINHVTKSYGAGGLVQIRSDPHGAKP